jgi:16S rRNA (adenine1518-N6/adenine1519-N6)-dimethyltransferase
VDFNIHNIDILKYVPVPPPVTNITQETPYNYSVIANIPYYITSPILRHFLYDVNTKPESMVILMQKDVGDKILLGQDI